jgi:flagellin-like protein
VSLQHDPDRAGSPVTGVILMIAITMVIAMLVLLLCLGFQMPHADTPVPLIFQITNVVHTDLHGNMNRESYLVLKNIGRNSYPNKRLSLKLYVNDVPANIYIPTLNSDNLIHGPHHGFKNLGGLGTTGARNKEDGRWYPDQMIWIDFNEGTFGPGDILRIEIYDETTGKILSGDTYPPTCNKYTTQWFYNYFLNPQAA